MKKYILIVIGLLFVTSYLIVDNARANPSRLSTPSSCASATATTTLSYVRAGTATTTLTCDTSKNGVGVDTFEKAYLALQHTASSTSSTITIRFEYSQDGIDWYASNIFDQTGLSTTTATSIIYDGVTHSHQINFASSTNACADAVIANNNLNCHLIPVPVPTRYVRAVFTAPAGATGSGVWAQFIGKAETIR